MRQVKELGQYLRYGGAIPPYAVHLSWWHAPVFGYLMSFLLVAVVGVLVKFFLLREAHFIWIPFCLVSVVVGFIWGVSPALLATLLGFVAFNLFIIPQDDIFSVNIWNDLKIAGPFVFAQCTIALLAAQNAVKHRRELIAQQKIQIYAQELEAANQLKDYFVTRAAHELRTPLTSILGETQLALRRLDRGRSTLPVCRESFIRVQERARGLHALLEDLLALSSLRSDEAFLQLNSCDFKKICREVAEEQRTSSQRQITLQLPEQPLILQADCGRLSQVVSNLVSNAIAYSPEWSQIAVKVSALNSHVLLQIHNEGPALSREQQKRLFEPFYRTPFAENVHREGWGLGLPISKEIVERHGGRIRVESSTERGTTFFVELPREAKRTRE
jgi:signal transduction histidine kinase